MVDIKKSDKELLKKLKKERLKMEREMNEQDSEKCCNNPRIIQDKNVLFCKNCGVVISEHTSSRKHSDGRNSSRISILPRGDDVY